MTTALRHAIAYTAALPIALLAHDSGMQPAHATTAAILLPATHAGIDIVVNGADTSPRCIATWTAFHAAAITILGLILTSVLGTF